MRLLIACLVVASVGCSNSEQERLKATSIPTYDQKTGKLTRITADLNKDGKIDTWTYMDGTTPLRTEQDLDGDGKIDRWEFVSPDGKVTKTMLSRLKTGKPDTWVSASPDGTVKMNFSPTADEHKITRWETYDKDRLVLVEEDTNGDGRPDKWEVHDGVPIISVEFDLNFDGVRDERITYGPGGKVVLIESQPDGRGGYIKRIRPK